MNQTASSSKKLSPIILLPLFLSIYSSDGNLANTTVSSTIQEHIHSTAFNIEESIVNLNTSTPHLSKKALSASFSSVEIAWGSAIQIENDNTGNAENPTVAFDSQGNAITVWHQNDGTRYNIWANHFNKVNNLWAGAMLIETDNTGDAYQPKITFDNNGNAMAVWRQLKNNLFNIWGNRFDAHSNSWGSATLIETNNTGHAFNPQIAFDNNGNANAVWYQYNGTLYNIWTNRFDKNNNRWGTATLIETNNAGHALNPQIAFDSNGNAISVWQQHDGTRYNIWANHFDSTSNRWHSATLIETDNAGNASSPQIAFDDNGNAIVVWNQTDGSHYNIWANRFDGSFNSWHTATLIETDNAGNASSPQIAFDSSGNAMAVWQQYDGTHINIWANRFNVNNNRWSNPTLIEAGNVGNASSPQISFDDNGNAMTVWNQSDGGDHNNIWANRFDINSQSWQTATLIETNNAGHAFNPQIAHNIAVWYQLDGTRYNIWSNQF